MEPVKWTPGGGFKVVSAGKERPSASLTRAEQHADCLHPIRSSAGDSGKVFEDVDLSEDWCEYDEDSDLSLEIMGLESRWETVR